ncbi:F-box only protein 15 isoform X2 [Hippopotamus amphibius kiboko]|uniref:F-box only protein 15 isoform X2 n=1 Tax=Hippopotamus amphibius kiboko TaxID=575201 RepID=UPI0025964AB8|nr:F-box only protein 15 isoform X2 [Hippopotamus amphibius kiboko]
MNQAWVFGDTDASLPSELLLQILSYLDAVSLLCAGCVNRRFYHLANDNFIWIRIFSTAFSPKRSNWKVNSVEKTAMSMKLLSVGDKEAGYWKKEYITKQIASVKAALARILKPLHPYTGLPIKTKEALRMSGLGWVIILKGNSGEEYIMEHVDLSINDSSVTAVWYGRDWPRLATLSTLDLCGVTPVFMDRSKTPTKNGPRWQSLIARFNLSHLARSPELGCDGRIRTFCLPPGLVVGLWKMPGLWLTCSSRRPLEKGSFRPGHLPPRQGRCARGRFLCSPASCCPTCRCVGLETNSSHRVCQREEELAFVMANLHFHHLVERSTFGSAAVPYELPPHTPVLDDSPERGLRGYQLHVDMHSGGVFCLCGTFRNLFTSKGVCQNFFHTNFGHFLRFLNCSIMDLTLLEEYGKPFWCFSSPVRMRASPVPRHGPPFPGETYRVEHADAEGRVHVQLVRIPHSSEYFIVSLALYLPVAKVNRWFGTDY